MNLDFFSSIRFKLAATYSVVIFVFFAAFLGLFNTYMRAYFLEPLDQENIVIGGRPHITKLFKELQKAEQARITEIRQEDFRRIQLISLISLIPIAVMSIGTGYLLSADYLNPLKILNKKIASRTSDNLGEQIDYDGPNDEVGQIISSFNAMANRLQGDFETQKQFIQDASHEIKTPLAVLQANIELVKDSFKKNSMEYKSLDNALNGVERLNALLNDLLTLSHSTADIDDLNLEELVQELANDLAQYAKDHQVELSLSIPSGKKAHIIDGNAATLYRAFRNIVENAIKYSSYSKDPKIEIKIAKTTTHTAVTITDNGPGIPKKDQPYIFDRFYRVDKSRTTNSGGNGLGLAIAKKILDEHNAQIKLDSKPGHTEFKILLPKIKTNS
jgi:two-component system sensor histidine kinase ArlS